MDKKLTLSLKERTIERAIRYAKGNITDLSRMIEAYLESLADVDISDEIKTTTLVNSLSGVATLPENYNYKISRLKYLRHKNY